MLQCCCHIMVTNNNLQYFLRFAGLKRIKPQYIRKSLICSRKYTNRMLASFHVIFMYLKFRNIFHSASWHQTVICVLYFVSSIQFKNISQIKKKFSLKNQFTETFLYISTPVSVCNTSV